MHPVEVALVGVFGVRVDGVLGEEAVDLLELLGVAIAAVGPGHKAEVGLASEDVDGHQAVGVAGVVREDVAGPLRPEVVDAGLLLAGGVGVLGLKFLEAVVGPDREGEDAEDRRGERARRTQALERAGGRVETSGSKPFGTSKSNRSGIPARRDAGRGS